MKTLVVHSSGSVRETDFADVGSMVKVLVGLSAQSYIELVDLGEGLALATFNFTGRANEAARRLGMALTSDGVLFRRSGADLEVADLAFYPLVVDECPHTTVTQYLPSVRDRAKLAKVMKQVVRRALPNHRSEWHNLGKLKAKNAR